MTRRPGRAPWGLLGALALVALVEATFTRYEERLMFPQHHDWRSAPRLAKAPEARRADVLCFGDSLVKLMVLPPTLESAHGLSAYNLAVPAGKPVISHAVFRRALRAGARPRAVVVDAGATLLGEPPGVPSMIRLAPEALSLFEMVELSWTARDPVLFARLAWPRLLRTLRARSEIRAVALSQARGEPPLWGSWLGMVHNRHVWTNRGAMAHRVDPARVPVVNEIAFGMTAAFVVDPVNAAYLDRFLALAESHGIPTFLVVPPFAPELQARLERTGYDAAHEVFIRGLSDRYPGLTVIDLRHLGFTTAQFHNDPFHLNGDAAAAATRAVGAAIRDRLDGPDRLAGGWVRPLPIDPASVRGLAVATGAEEYEATIERLSRPFSTLGRAPAPASGATMRR
jgi:hypothetical protein